MVKKIRKGLAMLLVVAMTLGMSTFAYAAEGGVTGITIKGVAANPQLTRSDFHLTAEAAYDNTFVFNLTREELDNTTEKLLEIAANTTGSVKVVKNPLETSLTDAAMAALIIGDYDSLESDTAAVNPGTIIWIMDGDTVGTEAKFLRIMINQKGDDITGTATVKSPTLNVIVPMSLNFALDPVQVTQPDSNNQVAAVDYRIINKSEAPVQVAFTINAIPKSGINLVANRHLVSPSDAGVTSKEAYFAIIGASGITGTSPTWGSTADGTIEYADAKLPDTALLKTIVPFGAVAGTGSASSTAKISLILDKATAGTPGGSLDTLATGNKGVTSFQFFSVLNTYAEWEGGDIGITGSYQISAMRGKDYSDLGANGKIVGLNMLKPNFADEPSSVIDDAKFPTSINIKPGEKFELDAKITVPAGNNIAYAWYKDGAVISGSTAEKFEIASLAGTDSGEYKVVITITETGSTGKIPVVISRTCKLDARESSATPVITTNLPGTKVAVNGDASATFTVAATTTAGSLSYKWYKVNGTTVTELTDSGDISGTATPTLTIATPTSSDDAKYYVVVTNTETGKAPVSVTSEMCDFSVKTTSTVGFLEGASETALAKTWTKSNGNLVIPFYFNSNNITSITYVNGMGSTVTLPATEYERNDTNHTLTLIATSSNAAFATGTRALTITVSGTTHVLTLTVQ